MDLLSFKASESLTLGVELELQLVDLSDFDLASGALDLLRLLERRSIQATVSPELTASMIEISCGIFRDWLEMREHLRRVRDDLVAAADWLNLGICGGGTHPFQRWHKRRIFKSDRFIKVSELYGYLAKQFTVFGQHIHVGCADGDTALRLLHALHSYIPHFIALSAASPFFQGVDTQFDSARLNSIAAFPLSGRAPYFLHWDRFCKEYFEPMLTTKIVRSMKDFYWDIRPKPEYGTIELRICDTPLNVDHAALIAGYMQLLCRWLLVSDCQPTEQEVMVYSFNRFQACRFGWEGSYVDPQTHKTMSIRDSFTYTVARCKAEVGCLSDAEQACIDILESIGTDESDASKLKSVYRQQGTLEDVVQFSMDHFRTASHAGSTVSA
ncbi:MAG: YbdK family carboxylate-amine ligase [Pirellula sp.]|jgi:carboxylate-amine ligase|nr:YbdK family carboxylate-amine ligase [Pirellula sp.]